VHKITLITGGVRSGKSSFALALAKTTYKKKVFIATAVPFDEEMRERIQNHQRERGSGFYTVEESLHLTEAVMNLPRDVDGVVVDCLTVWLGNLFHHYEEKQPSIKDEVDRFLGILGSLSSDLILVTNEVGWGIVPDNPLARAFRDMAGRLNREIAQKAHHVYLLCCGIPLTLKGALSYG
jgi:adenosylcobinamide kinase / adenosylcobinamide-phosphate guanylyltransferase